MFFIGFRIDYYNFASSFWQWFRGYGYLVSSIVVSFFVYLFLLFLLLMVFEIVSLLWLHCKQRGGRGSSAVERATPGEEVPGSIPAVAARFLQVGSVSVKCDRLRQKSWSPSSFSCVAARKIVRRSCLGARPRYNLVVDEDVKQPNKQTNKANSYRT